MDAQKIRQLYQSEDSFRKIFDHLASRTNNAAETKIPRMQAVLAGQGIDIDRSTFKRFFEALEGEGCGRYIVGRWGYPSRFAWEVNLKGVASIAIGESQVMPDAPAEETDSGMLDHRYFIRPDMELILSLPSDLTKTEAARLARFIDTLTFEDE